MTAVRESVCGVEDLLDRVERVTRNDTRVDVRMVLDAVGRHSFAPILLVCGLVIVAPVIGDIPGVPVIIGLLVLLTAGQLLMGRRYIWLPDWLLRRSADTGKVMQVVKWLRPVGAFLDRWTRPRLPWLVTNVGFYIVMLLCACIALATPLMEVVPFSASFAGLAITAFGLALVTGDGLIAGLAMSFTALTAGLVTFGLM